MPYKFIYRLFDDEHTVLEGTIDEIAEFLGIEYVANIYSYMCRNVRIHGKYKVEKIGVKQKIIEEKPKPISKKQSKIDYLEKHLREYGNTVSRDKPDKYLEELRQRGLNCTYRKVAEYSEGLSKIISHYYIVEVKNGL